MKQLAGPVVITIALAACGSAARPGATPATALSSRLTAPTTAVKTSRAPTSTTAPTPAPAPKSCPAASLTVTGTTGERIRAGWLPTGLVLTGGDTNLGAQGGAEYFERGGIDPPFVLVSRFHSAQPLRNLIVAAGIGTTEPVDVQGHAGLITPDGIGPPPTLAIGWTEAPGIEIEVQAHGITRTDAIRVANSVQYTSGGPFTYPIHPGVTITRARAVAALGPTGRDDARAVLTSFGELTAMRARDANHQSVTAPDVSVTQPVWVVWSSGGARADAAIVIDAHTGSTIAKIPSMASHTLDSLSDRSGPGCAPPFGVLTRSEAAYLQLPARGGMVTMKLTTEGALGRAPTFAQFSQCAVVACDATVPVWITVVTARDHRFLDGDVAGGPQAVTGPVGPTGTATTSPLPPGSWRLSAIDARTGPQTSGIGGGFYDTDGTPPADVQHLPDLSPP